MSLKQIAVLVIPNALTHRLWQVFGIERVNNKNAWVSVATPDPGAVPGETIKAALDELGVFAADPTFNSSLQTNLGAVNMSLGAGGGIDFFAKDTSGGELVIVTQRRE